MGTDISEIIRWFKRSCSSSRGCGHGAQAEFLRKWTIDVRVVDPDGVFTPNATVNAYENSIWLLGSKSTGPNGSLVSFEGTQYSKTNAVQLFLHSPSIGSYDDQLLQLNDV